MISLVKLIIVAILSLTFGVKKTIIITEENEFIASIETTKDSKKERAFEILNKKCNVCHNKHNKGKVLTKDNTNDCANEVYKLEFIKKRMPKGKRNKTHS